MSYTYTPQEYADMHLAYGAANLVSRQAALIYAERYPNRRHPNCRTFTNVHIAYSEGRIPGQRIEVGNTSRLKDDKVLKALKKYPKASLREIAFRTGVSKSSVQSILKRNHEESESESESE